MVNRNRIMTPPIWLV